MNANTTIHLHELLDHVQSNQPIKVKKETPVSKLVNHLVHRSDNRNVTTILNLDTCAFLSYISETTNCADEFSTEFIEQQNIFLQKQIQISKEEQSGAKLSEMLHTVIFELFDSVMITRVAYDEIEKIVLDENCGIAGPKEKQRARDLLQYEKLFVQERTNISDRCAKLRETKQMKMNDINIFGTADAISLDKSFCSNEAIATSDRDIIVFTLTGDSKLLRSCHNQHVDLDVILLSHTKSCLGV